MTVVATGCPNCEPLLREGPRTGAEHFAPRFNTLKDVATRCFIDGVETTDVLEAWIGSPGRAIRLKLENNKPRMCPCHPGYETETHDSIDGQVIPTFTEEPDVWRYLETYSEVRVETPFPVQ